MAKRRRSKFPEALCVCGRNLIDDEDDFGVIQRAGKLGRTEWRIRCGKCGRENVVNPKAILEGKAAKTTQGSYMFRCPEVQCTGFATNLGDDEWLCGECGQAWNSLKSVEKSIAKIVSTFAHRKKAYKRIGTHWAPVDADKEPKRYDELVEGEVIPKKKKTK